MQAFPTSVVRQISKMGTSLACSQFPHLVRIFSLHRDSLTTEKVFVMNTRLSNIARKKALPKLKQLKNTSVLNILGAEGLKSQACYSGPTCLPTQVDCGRYGPPANWAAHDKWQSLSQFQFDWTIRRFWYPTALPAPHETSKQPLNHVQAFVANV